MTVARSQDGHWHGHSGDLTLPVDRGYRARPAPGRTPACSILSCPPASHATWSWRSPGPPYPASCRTRTSCGAAPNGLGATACPDLSTSVATGESRHSYAVLRGLTGSTGAMVAAATTSLPERADRGRNYDYRYAWIRDQCYAGQAAAAIGDHTLLDGAVRFVSERVLTDGPDLRPAYTVAGGPVPDQRDVALPGYPGAPVTGRQLGQQPVPARRTR